MKVYLLLHGYDHEGFMIEGIYTTRELAEKASDNVEYVYPVYGEWLEIEEHDVRDTATGMGT